MQFVVRFADQTVWDFNTIKAKVAVLTGTAGDDMLMGYDTDEVLSVLDGNDVLNGVGGSDTLDGGARNDWLSTGLGDNLVLFGRGSGEDTLTVDWVTPGGVARHDTICLAADVTPADVTVSRNVVDFEDGLVIRIKGTSAQLGILGYFMYPECDIVRLRFADGTVWDGATLRSMCRTGTAGNDFLADYAGDDVLRRLGGDDNLDTFWGNDTLDGGTGNDTLSSRGGSNTFVFSRGDGQDVIASTNSEAGKTNTVVFRDVSSADLQLAREGNKLVLRIASTTDRITVTNHYLTQNGASVHAIDAIRFADGTTWDRQAIAAAPATIR